MSILRVTYEAEFDDGDHHKVIIEDGNPDAAIEDVGTMLKQLLAGAGFHHKRISELFGDDDGLD